MADHDVEKNKLMAIIGYIVPLLFFVPLVTDAKDSPFARFHANQQLVLLIVAIAVNIAGTLIPVIGWFLIFPIGMIAVIILMVIGVINASRGETKPLPVVGGAELIK